MNKRFILFAVLVALATAGTYLYFRFGRNTARLRVMQPWFEDNSLYADSRMKAGTRCGSAPFTFPTDGLVGFIWDDYFNRHRHQGLDIFAGTDVGITPIYAAYPGYLTRKAEWKSSVIIRVPDDPIHPGLQIWVYYTHMADPDGNSLIAEQFPPGTAEAHVETGTLLGYQGNYSGDPYNPVGVHLHISIVKDDGSGNFLNELEIGNTYDPSPYFGMSLNANENTDSIPVCQ
jgi:murein DD-endopeptidase MepM/ murein hydrolase activator NlpD